MYPTRDTLPLIHLNLAGGRVMPGGMLPETRTMNKAIRGLMAILALTLAAGFHSRAFSQGKGWNEIRRRPLLKFDWNCASPSAYPKAKLERVVRASARRERIEVEAEADRAFAFDLNGDRKPEYFVPLVCGVTGNCAWGVFNLKPAQFLGVVSGQFIYVHRRARRWPDLINYSHFTVADGYIGTYRYWKGRYAQLRDTYHTGVRGGIYGNEIPSFLDRARAGCADVEY